MPGSSSKKKSRRKNTNSCFSRISASIKNNILLTARLPSLRDRQKARLEKELAVAELVGETVKKKAKVLKRAKALKGLKKVGNKKIKK